MQSFFDHYCSMCGILNWRCSFWPPVTQIISWTWGGWREGQWRSSIRLRLPVCRSGQTVTYLGKFAFDTPPSGSIGGSGWCPDNNIIQSGECGNPGGVTVTWQTSPPRVFSERQHGCPVVRHGASIRTTPSCLLDLWRDIPRTGDVSPQPGHVLVSTLPEHRLPHHLQTGHGWKSLFYDSRLQPLPSPGGHRSDGA